MAYHGSFSLDMDTSADMAPQARLNSVLSRLRQLEQRLPADVRPELHAVAEDLKAVAADVEHPAPSASAMYDMEFWDLPMVDQLLDGVDVDPLDPTIANAAVAVQAGSSASAQSTHFVAGLHVMAGQPLSGLQMMAGHPLPQMQPLPSPCMYQSHAQQPQQSPPQKEHQNKMHPPKKQPNRPRREVPKICQRCDRPPNMDTKKPFCFTRNCCARCAKAQIRQEKKELKELESRHGADAANVHLVLNHDPQAEADEQMAVPAVSAAVAAVAAIGPDGRGAFTLPVPAIHRSRGEMPVDQGPRVRSLWVVPRNAEDPPEELDDQEYQREQSEARNIFARVFGSAVLRYLNGHFTSKLFGEDFKVSSNLQRGPPPRGNYNAEIIGTFNARRTGTSHNVILIVRGAYEAYEGPRFNKFLAFAVIRSIAGHRFCDGIHVHLH